MNPHRDFPSHQNKVLALFWMCCFAFPLAARRNKQQQWKTSCSLPLVIVNCCFHLKFQRDSGEAGGSTSLVLPSIYHEHGMHGVLPEHLLCLCLLPNSLKLQFTSKCHHHLILTQMPFLPSFLLPRDASCEPHVSACQLPTSHVWPKSSLDLLSQGWQEKQSSSTSPAQPSLDAIQGAAWHPCMELGHREPCSVGLHSDFCCEAENPTAHHN